MAGRYWISGVQLGLLKAFFETQSNSDKGIKLVDAVLENQFVGNIDNEYEQEVVIQPMAQNRKTVGQRTLVGQSFDSGGSSGSFD